MDKVRNLLKRVRDFIRCCKKTTEEIDSILEDIDDLTEETVFDW